MLRQQNCFQALILWFAWKETIPITCSHSITASQSNFNRIDKIKRWLIALDRGNKVWCVWEEFSIGMNDFFHQNEWWSVEIGRHVWRHFGQKYKFKKSKNASRKLDCQFFYLYVSCLCLYVCKFVVCPSVRMFVFTFVRKFVGMFVRSLIRLFVCLFFRLMHRQVSLYINRGLGFHTNAVNGIERTTDQKSNQNKSYNILEKRNRSLINLGHIKSWNLL